MIKSITSQQKWRANNRQRVRYLNDRSAVKRYIRNSTDNDLHNMIEMAVEEQNSRPSSIKYLAKTIVNTWPQYNYDYHSMQNLVKVWRKVSSDGKIYQAICYTKKTYGTRDLQIRPLTCIFDVVIHPRMTKSVHV